MSRAFVKEEDGRDDLPDIPERAPLPPGALNYVTPSGMEQLLAERARLEYEREGLLGEPDDDNRRSKLYLVAGRLAKLAERIAGARVIDLAAQPADEVRFGASVTLELCAGERAGTRRTFQIVGVDEASAVDGRIAFTAPLARALVGCQVGDVVRLETPGGNEEFEITHIKYA